jgi:hypothetical protein
MLVFYPGFGITEYQACVRPPAFSLAFGATATGWLYFITLGGGYESTAVLVSRGRRPTLILRLRHVQQPFFDLVHLGGFLAVNSLSGALDFGNPGCIFLFIFGMSTGTTTSGGDFNNRGTVKSSLTTVF